MFGSAVSLDDGLIQAVRIGVGNRSGLEHQPVIDRRIERIDDRVHIEIGPQVTLFHRKLDRSPGELSSRQDPTLPEGIQDVRIELPVADERANHVPVLAAKGLHLSLHLQLNAVDGAVRGRKYSFRANNGKKGIHDDGPFVRPAPVDCGLPNTGLGCNRLHGKSSEANFEGQVERGIQDQLANLVVARPSSASI